MLPLVQYVYDKGSEEVLVERGKILHILRPVPAAPCCASIAIALVALTELRDLCHSLKGAKDIKTLACFHTFLTIVLSEHS